MLKCHLKDKKNQTDPLTLEDPAFQRIKLISESTQYFLMILFLNLTLLSSRCSFQLSSHLEYVFITKIIFKELFKPLQILFIITDRANLALLTWPPVIGVKTRGHLIY